MAKTKTRAVLSAPPTPAVRVVYGLAFEVARRPAGIVSPATDAIQRVAASARSQQPQVWGVFPVFGRDVVVAGFLSARAPRTLATAWAVEPGGALATTHSVVAYELTRGASVGPLRDDRADADCVEDIMAELSKSAAWGALGASRLDATTLPGGGAIEGGYWPTYFLLTDDGRGGDVVYGMSHWRAGDAYAGGRVQTWARSVGEDEAVRVVGVRVARVDVEAPLAVAPARQGGDAFARVDAIQRETRAVLDGERPFGWYLIADAPLAERG